MSTATCSSSTFNLTNVNAGTSTCFKWRVISSDSSNVTLQLDHTLFMSYVSEDGSSNWNTIFSQLRDKTSTWTRVPLLNFTNQYSRYSGYDITCTNGVCTIRSAGGSAVYLGGSSGEYRARIITINELIDIINTKAASTAVSQTCATDGNANNCTTPMYFSAKNRNIGETSTNGTNTDLSLSWLIENTTSYTDSGATANSYKYYQYNSNILVSSATQDGYWVLGSSKNYGGHSRTIYYQGYLNTKSQSDLYGVRPVVTVPKSLVN